MSEFRLRLIEGGAERQLLDAMLSRFAEKGLLKAPKQQRTDSSHVLAAIRTLSRLENIGETLRRITRQGSCQGTLRRETSLCPLAAFL